MGGAKRYQHGMRSRWVSQVLKPSCALSHRLDAGEVSVAAVGADLVVTEGDQRSGGGIDADAVAADRRRAYVENGAGRFRLNANEQIGDDACFLDREIDLPRGRIDAGIAVCRSDAVAHRACDSAETSEKQAD